MITKETKEISSITFKGRTITEIWRQNKQVFASIRSCFGSGAWLNYKPYINDEGWINN